MGLIGMVAAAIGRIRPPWADFEDARRELEDARNEAAATGEYADTLFRAAQHPGEWQRVPDWAQRPGDFTAIRWKTPDERKP